MELELLRDVEVGRGDRQVEISHLFFVNDTLTLVNQRRGYLPKVCTFAFSSCIGAQHQLEKIKIGENW